MALVIEDPEVERMALELSRQRGLSVQEVVRKLLSEAVGPEADDREDSPIVLTPDQIAIVQEARAEIRAGQFLTSEQLKADLAAHRAQYGA